MELKKLLSIRKEIKSRKPKFVRQEYHKRKKLAKKWRQPKGMHSKLRQKFKGHLKHPSPGYRPPKKTRGLDKSGLKPIIVSNGDELNYVSKDCGVIISRRVGLKKKIEILKKAKEKGIVVLNIKNIDEFLKSIGESRKSKKEKAKQREEEKRKSREEILKKAEEKKEEKPHEEKELKEKKAVLEMPK